MPLPPLPVRRTHARARAIGVLAALLGVGLVSTAAAPGALPIRPGDTLSGIAARTGTTVAALKAANRLTSDRIIAGRTLRVPGTAPERRVHVVRRGENLTVIARATGTTIRALRSANRLPVGALLQPGQRLVVPGAPATGARTAPAPTGAASSNQPPRYPDSVTRSAARHRAQLAARDLPSKARVRRLVAQAARRHGVPVPLALAVAYHESGFQQRVVSPADAIGAMQVLPSTGRGLSRAAGRELDLLDARDNVTAGVLLLRQLLRITGSQDPALAGYYQGLGSVARRGVLPQTRAYIRSIHVLQPRFRNG